jgi:hypothetical protein
VGLVLLAAPSGGSVQQAAPLVLRVLSLLWVGGVVTRLRYCEDARGMRGGVDVGGDTRDRHWRLIS